MADCTALSFLGTGKYKETTYRWDGRSCTTRFMPVALETLFDPEPLLVAVTPGAQAKHGAALRSACSFEAIEVPKATEKSAWWRMFNALTGAVPPETRLMVDITHGFRSQPFLALAVVVYLRAVKDVEVERIVYGAFEARSENNITPIHDLTPFLHLLDGAEATRIFTDYGDARPLRDTFRTMTGDVSGRREDETGDIQSTGDQLARLTTALSMNRPQEAFRLSEQMIGQLEASMGEAMDVPQARPLRRLILTLARHFAPLGRAGGDPFSEGGFTAQAAMLRFYLETEQYLQAFTFAREALVTFACVTEGFDPTEEGTYDGDYTEPSGRKGAVSHLQRLSLQDAATTEDEVELAGLWSEVRHYRNDIAHPDFSDTGSGSGRLVAEAQHTLRSVASFLSEVGPIPIQKEA